MEKENIIDTVIKNDYCIGCGACSFANKDFKVGYDKFGMYKAMWNGKELSSDDKSVHVCPFSNQSKNEDEISNEIFKSAEGHNGYIGRYIQSYVGHVTEDSFRVKGSSGGFSKWILAELLRTGVVDYVIQVNSGEEEGKLFTYNVYSDYREVINGSKSAYYPVTLQEALEFIEKNDGRYAVTAIPCFSKALRNICSLYPEINDKIKFIIGIICGHLKSTGFAESLGWQLDVKPSQLQGIEFRGKIEGLKANEKGVYAVNDRGEKSDIVSSKKLFGGNWGYGFFKYKACDYCDDVVGETADVSVGDAWLKEIMDDHRGSNVIIIRNQIIGTLTQKAIEEGRLNLTKVNEDVVVRSQYGGIRHRREGLKYRLYLRKRKGEWAPKKRVLPSKDLEPARKKIYRVRENLRHYSHIYFKKAKEKDDYSYFERKMNNILQNLGLSLLDKIRVSVKRSIKRIKK